MSCNVGKVDRAIRFTLGAVISGYFFGFTSGNVQWWGIIGLVFVATALFRWCPTWWALRVNTIEERWNKKP